MRQSGEREQVARRAGQAKTGRLDTKLRVTDRELSPNHAWRHTFKQLADRHEITERMSDSITGHAPKSVGAGYGAATLEDKAEALKKFPRYTLG